MNDLKGERALDVLLAAGSLGRRSWSTLNFIHRQRRGTADTVQDTLDALEQLVASGHVRKTAAGEDLTLYGAAMNRWLPVPVAREGK